MDVKLKNKRKNNQLNEGAKSLTRATIANKSFSVSNTKYLDKLPKNISHFQTFKFFSAYFQVKR